MARPAEPFATVLSRWIRRERLRPSHIQRVAGITPAHYYQMLGGKIARPFPSTLRALARALATDPATGELDQLKRDEALRELSLAAGYPDLAGDPYDGDLVRAIRALGGNLQVADFWAEVVGENLEILPTDQHILRAFLELRKRSRGSDGLALLALLSLPAPLTLDEILRRLPPVDPAE